MFLNGTFGHIDSEQSKHLSTGGKQQSRKSPVDIDPIKVFSQNILSLLKRFFW